MKFQSYILSFLFFCFVLLFFLTGKQSMKTPMKVFIKVQRIVGTLSRMWSRYLITFNCIFSGEDDLWFFFFFFLIIFVTLIHIFRKYHISMYLLRKTIFHFPSKEKISYFPEKNTRKIIFQCNLFWKRPSFQGIWKKYHISIYFFEKYRLLFSF